MFLACAWVAKGQGGAWMPANADFSYPRTLFKVAEADSVRAYLLEPEIYSLYALLYSQSQSQGIPSSLNDDAQRRLTAHLAKNCAFIHLLNRKPVSGGLDTLSGTEKLFFRDKALLCLSRINTAVDPFPSGFDSYLWRSNEIADNLIGWDLLKGANVPDSLLSTGRNLLVEYLGNLHKESTTELFGYGFFASRVNNHALRSASVFGLGAVVLNDVVSNDNDEQPMSWLQTGLGYQEDVLWRNSGRQSEAGVLAGYAEGPHYFKFGSKHMLEFNHAMGNFLPDTVLQISIAGNNWSIQNPWHDNRYDLLFEWMTRIRMADGRMPPLEDSFSDHGFPEMAIMEQSKWNSPMYFSKWDQDQTIGIWRQLRSSTDDLVADYIASRTPPIPDTYGHLQGLPESGDLIFRSGWDSNAVWYHMYGQHGRARTSGMGHNQADEASFMLQAYGEYLAFDPGYVKWDRRNEVSLAEDHNMILVNGAGPNTGTIGSANGADAFIRRTYEGKFIRFGDVETSYQSANILRNSIFVRDRYVLLGDVATTSQNREFEWRLHGSGLEGGDSISGVFEFFGTDGKGYWRKNGVTLLAQVIGGNGGAAYDKLNHQHELTYDSLVPHTAFLARQTSTQRGVFLSALIPYTIDSPVVTQWSGTGQSFLADWGGYRDFGLCATLPSSQSGLPSDIQLEGDYGVYSLDSADRFAFMVLQGGKRLTYAGNVSLSASADCYIVLEQLLPNRYRGYYVGPTGNNVLFEYLSFSPLSAIGSPVQSFAGGTNSITVAMGGEGIFELTDSLVVGLAQQVEAKPDFQVFPNPSTGYISFKLPEFVGENEEWKAILWNLDGRRVWESAIQGKAGTLDFAGLPAGTYALTLLNEKFHFSEKVVLLRD